MATILAAIDNSAAARSVLAAAQALARAAGSDVEAIHVRENGDLTASAAARAAGVAFGERSDSPAPTILHEVARDDVRALVMGARDLPSGSGVVGHVALEVIATAGKPLLAVPPAARLPRAIRRILAPLDGTAAAATAVATAIQLLCGADVEVIVLHVHDPMSVPPFSDQPQHELDAWREEFLRRQGDCLQGDRVEIRVGLPGESVLAVAAETQADLIAMGWSQDLSAGHARVVREVLAHGTTPVLLIPADSSRTLAEVSARAAPAA